VSVCTNVTCLVTGGPEVLDHLEARYAQEADITVEEVECLAACDGAPALQVNYEFHERVSPSSAEEIVESYRSGARRARTVSGAPVA
jgi:NADH-quinone oxidoreductase subunit E